MGISQVLQHPKKQVSLPKPILKTKPEPVIQIRSITKEKAKKQILQISNHDYYNRIEKFFIIIYLPN